MRGEFRRRVFPRSAVRLAAEPAAPRPDRLCIGVGASAEATGAIFPRFVQPGWEHASASSLAEANEVGQRDEIAVVAGSMAELRRALPLLARAGTAKKVTIAVLTTARPDLMRPPRTSQRPIRDCRVVRGANGSVSVTVRVAAPVDVGTLAREVLLPPLRTGGATSHAETPRWEIDDDLWLPPVDAALLSPRGFQRESADPIGALAVGGAAAAPGREFTICDAAGAFVARGDLREGLTENHVAALRPMRGVSLVGDPADDVRGWGRLLTQLACTGVPVSSTPVLPERLRQALGHDLAERFSGAPSLDTTRDRENWSIMTRRIALGRFLPGLHGRDVSVLLCTRRPTFVSFALAQVERQDWPEIQTVLVLHGMARDHPEVRRAIQTFNRPIEVVEVSADVVFGAALNEGVDRCTGRLLTRMDDDDWYGPSHITDLVQARVHSGANLVGLAEFWMYLQESDVTLFRSGASEIGVEWVAGASIMLATEDVLALGGWHEVPVSEDLLLQRALLAAGGEMYSINPQGFLVYRGHEHTYVVAGGDQEWLGRPEYPRLPGFRPPLQLAPLAHPRRHPR